MRDWATDVPLAARGAPVKDLDPAVPVRFWAHVSGEGYIQMQGRATAYTPISGHVVYTDEHGREGSVWAWASAITRR